MIQALPAIKIAFKNEELFQILLRGLPYKYTTIRDSIRTLMNVTVEDRLRMLRDKEDELKRSKQIIVAKQSKFLITQKDERRSQPQKRSKSRRSQLLGSDSDLPRTKCFIYKDATHYVVACPFLSNAQSYAKRELSRSSQRKPVKKSRERAPYRYHKNKKKRRAYDTESDTSEGNPDGSDADDDEDIEVAAVSRDAASKIPHLK